MKNWVIEFEFSVKSPTDSFKGGDGIAMYYLETVPKKHVQKNKFGYLNQF